MKTKNIILAICAGILVLTLLQSTSAYYSHESYPAYSYNSFHYSYTPSFAVSSSYSPDDYYDKYPAIYRKFKYSGTSEDPVVKWVSQGADFEEKVKRARAAVWLAESHDWRYNLASGRTSGEVFSYTDGATDTEAQSSTNWRYKEAYDPRVFGPQTGYTDNYYYQPRYDSETGTYNWQY